MTRLTPKERRDGHQQRFEKLLLTIEPAVSHGWLWSGYPTQRNRHLLLGSPVWGKVSLEGFSSASALTSGHLTYSNSLVYMVWFYENAFVVQGFTPGKLNENIWLALEVQSSPSSNRSVSCWPEPAKASHPCCQSEHRKRPEKSIRICLGSWDEQHLVSIWSLQPFKCRMTIGMLYWGFPTLWYQKHILRGTNDAAETKTDTGIN